MRYQWCAISGKGEDIPPCPALPCPATYVPHVDAVVVEAVGAEHELGRAVPPRHHVLRHGLLDLLVGVPPFPRGPGAREAEVGDAELAGARDEEVARLEVAVDDAVVVQVLEALEHLGVARGVVVGKMHGID